MTRATGRIPLLAVAPLAPAAPGARWRNRYPQLVGSKHHVHVEFFIWRDDPRGRAIRDHYPQPCAVAADLADVRRSA